MDWLLVVKFLHVASAVIWVGGGFVLFLSGLLAERRKDDPQVAEILRIVVVLSPIFFIPVSLATVIFGVIMAATFNLWSQAWIILGLLGFIATFCIGLFILKPTSELFTKYNNAGQVAEAKTQGAKMLTASKFDYVLLFAVIFDMVMQPQWSDWVPLLIIAIAIAAAGYFFLYPLLSGRATAATA